VEKKGFLSIGKIIGAHGVKGNVKIYSYAESFSMFDSLRLIQIKAPTGKEKQYAIEWAKPHSRTILLSLEGINDREQAEALIGSKLLIEKTHLAELGQGEYYWFEIIGLSVFSLFLIVCPVNAADVAGKQTVFVDKLTNGILDGIYHQEDRLLCCIPL